jgi:hypothetical protein
VLCHAGASPLREDVDARAPSDAMGAVVC